MRPCGLGIDRSLALIAGSDPVPLRQVRLEPLDLVGVTPKNGFPENSLQ